jgi:phage N-6-adenine-methyltransferase
MTRRCPMCSSPLVTAPTGRPKRPCSDKCRMAAWRKRRRRSVHFSSATPEWATPPDVFAALDAEFGPFDLDPCATSENAKCERYFTRKDDGLEQVWAGRVWLNPPYGRTIGAWMEKAWEASRSSAELVVYLVPARTDTHWWHKYCTQGEVRFLRGRLRFGGCANSAPFPSAVVVFRNAADVTKHARFNLLGGDET